MRTGIFQANRVLNLRGGMKGKKHSLETRLKQSLAAKGKKKSPEIYGPEWREKQRKSQTGRKRSEATRKKMGDAIRGALHYNWKGGITREDKQFRQSPEYKIWRRCVFVRDNYTCQACDQKGGYLYADHELPFALFPQLRLEVLNGRTLCGPCHKKTPSFGGKMHAKDSIYA